MISMKNLGFATFFIAGMATNLNAMDRPAAYAQDVEELSSDGIEILKNLEQKNTIGSYLIITRIPALSLHGITAAISTIRKVIKKEHFYISGISQTTLFHCIPYMPYNPKLTIPITQAFSEIAGADAPSFILKPNVTGYSPLDLARIWKNTEIVELFEEAINTNN